MALFHRLPQECLDKIIFIYLQDGRYESLFNLIDGASLEGRKIYLEKNLADHPYTGFKNILISAFDLSYLIIQSSTIISPNIFQKFERLSSVLFPQKNF